MFCNGAGLGPLQERCACVCAVVVSGLSGHGTNASVSSPQVQRELNAHKGGGSAQQAFDTL